jgi:hypothetical protein
MFEWTNLYQQAFEKMKALLVTDTLLCYPDHNIPFQIEADASDCQLGLVIKQKGYPVA